jgi:O-antigen/teichoic acid export membrane protein
MLQRLMTAGSTWAIADQMVASAGNFVVALLLARGLPQAEFGTFVLLNSVCLIVYGFHTNLVVSPLVVFGASASANKIRIYPTAALAFTVALLPVTALVVFLASVSLHREVTGALAILYALAWQLQETTRRALTSRLRYRDALWGDAISYLGQACIVGLLTLRAGTTLNTVFLTMAATSLVAAALQSWQARLAPATWTQLRECRTEFWTLGKWMVVVSLTSMIAGPLFPWLLNWFHGRESAAAFQAVMNVVGLVNPLIISIPAIVMPVAANFLLTPGGSSRRSLLGLAMKYIAQFELLLAPWLLILLLWPHSALIWFYGKATAYGNQAFPLRMGVLVYILTVPMTVFGAVLTGSGRTKSNAAMQGVGAVASLVCAPSLIFVGGVVGAMLAETVARGVRVLYAVRSLGSSRIASSVETV